MANAERFCDPEYVPTELDILKVRVKTTGITETVFFNGKNKFRFVSLWVFEVTQTNDIFSTLEWSMLEAREMNERNGFTVSKMSLQLSFVLLLTSSFC